MIVVNSTEKVIEKLNGYNVIYETVTNKTINKDVYKISYFIVDNDVTSIQKQIRIEDVNAFISHKYMIDITPLNINKGFALKTLQLRYDITPNMTCAFGDSENDVDMFKEAYYSYAMNNAPDNVKNNAFRIAPSNNQEGVVTVIKQLFSIDKI